MRCAGFSSVAGRRRMLPPSSCVLVLLLAAAASAAPTLEDQITYDQRQNGTDNLRVQMSDVTLVVAPAEALLAVAAPSELLLESQVKPKYVDKPPSRSKLRLANLLMNVFNKGRSL